MRDSRHRQKHSIPPAKCQWDWELPNRSNMENPEMFRIKVRGTEVQKGAFHKMIIKIKSTLLYLLQLLFWSGCPVFGENDFENNHFWPEVAQLKTKIAKIRTIRPFIARWKSLKSHLTKPNTMICWITVLQSIVQFFAETVFNNAISGQKRLNSKQKSQKTGHKTVCAVL